MEIIAHRINSINKLKNLNINLDNAYEKILLGVNSRRLKNNPVEISFEEIKKILNSINR